MTDHNEGHVIHIHESASQGESSEAQSLRPREGLARY